MFMLVDSIILTSSYTTIFGFPFQQFCEWDNGTQSRMVGEDTERRRDSSMPRILIKKRIVQWHFNVFSDCQFTGFSLGLLLLPLLCTHNEPSYIQKILSIRSLRSTCCWALQLCLWVSLMLNDSNKTGYFPSLCVSDLPSNKRSTHKGIRIAEAAANNNNKKFVDISE